MFNLLVMSTALSSEFTVEDLSLLTDLYQVTMATCYVGEGLELASASFELFVLRTPAVAV